MVEVDVPLAKLPPALAGFTIVQLSDIHVGPTIKREYVQAIVDRVNQLDADLIAITGDVVDGSVEHLRAHTAPLGSLRSRHGSYVVTGNHEYYSDAAAWTREFERIGLRGLHNSHVVITHRGARLVLAGVTDFSAAAFADAPASDPVAALAGSPPDLARHPPRSPTALGPPPPKPPASTSSSRAILTVASSGRGTTSFPLQQPFTRRPAPARPAGGLHPAAAPATGDRPKRLGAPVGDYRVAPDDGLSGSLGRRWANTVFAMLQLFPRPVQPKNAHPRLAR